MNFRLNEDQRALRAAVRDFCDGRVAFERLPELARAGGVERALWSELALLGVFGLRLPESEGGVGLGSADAVVVFSELGRRLVPGPILWTHLAAGLVPGAAAGDVVVGGVDLLGPAGPLLVEHPEALDRLLVLRPEGVQSLDARTLDFRPVAPALDPLTPLGQLEALPAGELVASPADARRLRLEGAALAAAGLLGLAEGAREIAVAYAKRREQFGRPIGGFQAVKHLLADAFVREQAARAAVWAAGATLDQPAVGDVARAVASAKVVAGAAALQNARTCIQVHGGMGYTWQMPPHYYLKRAWVWELAFGVREEHEEAVAAHVAREALGAVAGL